MSQWLENLAIKALEQAWPGTGRPRASRGELNPKRLKTAMRLRINDPSIDWLSRDSHYFFNPLAPGAAGLQALAKRLPFLPGHIYLFSSGGQKICLLSKEAFLASAKSVNQFLSCHPKDCWALSLPLFHTGGLSILARSFSGGFAFKETGKKPGGQGGFSWDPSKWRAEAEAHGATLASLVPAQVYDLIQKSLPPPKKLRAAVVGGEALPPALYRRACCLGWPLLPSYGLTEAASQAATAKLSSLSAGRDAKQALQPKNCLPRLKILPHIQIRAEKSALKIKSPSLLTGVFDPKTEEFKDPKDSEGWLALDDLGAKLGEFLEIKGRKDEMIKILGELVDLRELSRLLDKIAEEVFAADSPAGAEAPGGAEFHLAAVPHRRKGFELNLLTSSFDQRRIAALTEKFNRQALPAARIQKTYCAPRIKKSSLFKARQQILRRQIGFSE